MVVIGQLQLNKNVVICLGLMGFQTGVFTLPFALGGKNTKSGEERAQMLQLVGTNATARAALEYTRNQVMEPAFQNALTANATISTTQPYETAVKQINELRIRHLLGQVMTQALYLQALAIAVQGDSIAGTAALDALVFLAPCDQVLYQDSDERSHVQQNHDNIAVPSLSVAPNPSSGLIQVSFPNLNGGTLTVYNTKGQVVKSQSIPQGHSKVSLELKSSTSGAYWVVFTNTEGKVVDTVKILLNH